MTNRIKLKRNAVANAVPSAGDLEYGELAINYTDGNLFFKDSSNAVQTIASLKFANVSGNITGGNLVIAGNANVGNLGTSGSITATGNIQGNYFVGNGSQLTGIIASAGAQIINGTSNVTVAGSSNVTVGVAGNTVGTFYSGGFVTTGNVQGNFFIGNGSQLTGLTSDAFNIISVAGQSNITASGATTLNLESIYTGATGNLVIYTYTGNNTVQFADAALGFWQQNENFGLVTDATLTYSEDLGLVTASVTEQYNLGDVADTFAAIQANGLYVQNTAVIASSATFESSVQIDGDLTVSGNFVLPPLNNITITGNITGNLVPAGNAVYDLGSSMLQWRDLYLSGNTMYIGSAQISASGSNIVLPATVQIGDATLTATGNTLSLPPDITATTLTLSGNANIAGNTALTGNVTVSNAMVMNGNTSINGNLVANVTFKDNRGITFTDGSVLQSANTFMIIAVSDETTALTTGAAKVTFRAPFAMTLPQVPRASLTTASSSGNVAVDINASGNSILSTGITINANQTTSTTASAAPVLSTTSIADDAQITIDIDSAGTNAAGLKVVLYYRRANL